MGLVRQFGAHHTSTGSVGLANENGCQYIPRISGDVAAQAAPIYSGFDLISSCCICVYVCVLGKTFGILISGHGYCPSLCPCLPSQHPCWALTGCSVLVDPMYSAGYATLCPRVYLCVEMESRHQIFRIDTYVYTHIYICMYVCMYVCM